MQSLGGFEQIVRKAGQFNEAPSRVAGGTHPFEERNIHASLPSTVRDLFDDGHYSQATFEAYKFVDKEVQRHSKSQESGYRLMMQAFAAESPLIQLNHLMTQTEKDEQKGYQFVFAGAVLAIRNPRGHEIGLTDSPDRCLDHVGLASLLLRRLNEAGFK